MIQTRADHLTDILRRNAGVSFAEPDGWLGNTPLYENTAAAAHKRESGRAWLLDPDATVVPSLDDVPGWTRLPSGPLSTRFTPEAWTLPAVMLDTSAIAVKVDFGTDGVATAGWNAAGQQIAIDKYGIGQGPLPPQAPAMIATPLIQAYLGTSPTLTEPISAATLGTSFADPSLASWIQDQYRRHGVQPLMEDVTRWFGFIWNGTATKADLITTLDNFYGPDNGTQTGVPVLAGTVNPAPKKALAPTPSSVQPIGLLGATQGRGAATGIAANVKASTASGNIAHAPSGPSHWPLILAVVLALYFATR